MITTQWLQGEQLSVISGLVEQFGWTPLPASALALAAFDERGLAGFHVLQLRPHAEPLWVRDDLRSSGLAGDLAGEMSEFLHSTGTKGFMAIADTPEAVKLCESLGMKRVESPVYIR